MKNSILSKFIIIIFITFSVISAYLIKNLIYSNQAKSLIMQIKKINNAIDGFTEKYHSLPGDATNTLEYGITKYSTDGNGDNSVLDPTNRIVLAQGEIVNFWMHLSNSKMLNEKYDGMEMEMAKINSTFPTSVIGNAGIIAYSDQGKSYLQIGFMYSDSSRIYTKNDTLTPIEAYLVDKKTDDENPYKGIVRVLGGDILNFQKNSICANGNAYRLKVDKPSCQLRIEIK